MNPSMASSGRVDVLLRAIARYEAAASRNAALTKRIGEALNQCPVNAELEALQTAWPPRDASHLMDGARTKTHLYHAFAETVPCDSGYGDRHMSSDEIEDYLSDADEGCVHCLSAFRLIEERKSVRHEFGIAKRSIRAIGRAALANIGAAP